MTAANYYVMAMMFALLALTVVGAFVEYYVEKSRPFLFIGFACLGALFLIIGLAMKFN